VHSPSPGERGAITAEMMIGLPILTAVIGVAMLGVQAGVTQMRLDDQVALQARYASLGGELEGVIRDGSLLCVEAEHVFDRGLWALDPLVLRARSCALNPEKVSGDGSAG
jgi:hypothetical protein